MNEARTLEKKKDHAEDDVVMPPELVKKVEKLAGEILVQIPIRGGDGIHERLSEATCLWVDAGIAVSHCKGFDGFLEVKRESMVLEFLKTDKKYLLMIDNDVVPFEPDLPIRLAMHDLPLVTAVVCAHRPDMGTFACFTVLDETGTARFPSVFETRTMPAEGVAEVQSCGTGALMIRRDVLETIKAKEPCFLAPESVRLEAAQIGHMRKTEDIIFVERARKYGFKAYADLAVHCWHDKTIPLAWPADRKDELLDVSDWDVTLKAPPQSFLVDD